MSRSFARALVAVMGTVALAAGLLVGAQTASAVGDEIQNVHAIPQPPGSMTITWDPYTTQAFDHYVVTVNPGSRVVDSVMSGDPTSATFENLTWGTNYNATVVAVDSGENALSDPGTLKIQGTKLRGSLVKVAAVRGDKVKISGTLTTANNKPLVGKKIVVQVALAPYKPPTYTRIGQTKSKKKGAYSFTTTADRNAIYRVLYKAKDTAGGWDGNMVLGVRCPVSLKFSSNPVSFGQQVTFSGKVSCPASLVAGAQVKLQQRINGKWKTAKTTRLNANAKYTVGYTPTSATDRAWRAWTQAGSSFATSNSFGKSLTVR
jgi:hypothetical protein